MRGKRHMGREKGRAVSLFRALAHFLVRVCPSNSSSILFQCLEFYAIRRLRCLINMEFLMPHLGVVKLAPKERCLFAQAN